MSTLSEQSHILWIASCRIHQLSTITSQTVDPVIACPSRGHLPFNLSAFSSLIKSPSDQSSSQLVKLDYRSTTIFCLMGLHISNTIPVNLVNFIKTII